MAQRKGDQKDRRVCSVQVPKEELSLAFKRVWVASLSQSRAICGRGAEKDLQVEARTSDVRSRVCSGPWRLIGSHCGFLRLRYDEQPGLQTGLQWGKLDVGTMALRLLQTFRHR